MLKALVVQRTKKLPPFIHDLRRLAEIAKIEMDQEKSKILDKIYTFNIAGRYADEKLKFFKEYSKKEFTERYLKNTKDLIVWLKKEFQRE